MSITSAHSLRDHLLEELRRDLVGPHSSGEQLRDRPTVQYLTGILYPSGVELDSTEDDSLGIGPTGDDDDDGPENIALSQTMNPASLGLSFATVGNLSSFVIAVSYGLYSAQEISDFTGKSITVWQRRQICETVQVPVIVGHDRHDALEGGASIEWIIRQDGAGYSITVFLVNRNTTESNAIPDDSQCLFQPFLKITSPDCAHPFVHRRPQGTLPPDADLEAYQLLYRECYEFATGHGCAVNWSDISKGHAGVLETAIVPDYHLPATTPNDIGGLDMQTLADAADATTVITTLQPLLDAYAQWISERRSEISSLESILQGAAVVHMARCEESLQRMQAGLELIRSEPRIFEAFKFANRAMLLQRSYGAWAQDFRKTGKRATSNPILQGAWRPFQIAFILLNLAGVTSPEHAERSIVDLLWFPTGGGKTEAYLGLTAFTIALRRLQGNVNGMRGDGGVTVIMRYTLRLLTTQQFQRAATLICACEFLRRQQPGKWGQEPFQIGLWVGSGATPNTIEGDEGAREALQKLRGGTEVNEGNPMQMPFCPWCGEELTAWNYHIDSLRNRMVVVCPRQECAFHGSARLLDRGIPALLVDEDIYRQCPTLLLATADKFARLPWKPQTMALFGRVDRLCPRHGYLTHTDKHSATHRAVDGAPQVSVQPCTPFLPPDLIIQDELHLIAGPLGTLAGLYETAIDILCSRPGQGNTLIRPKVIASTATIRRADDQVRSLFAREVRLFPPSGLDAGNSFFATAQPLETMPGRCYAGVFAPGRSVKTALVRVYAILLQVAGEYLATHGSGIADAYCTLVGYFNSLRELGGALRLVEDDIVQRIEYLANQRQQSPRTVGTENCELTSRIPSRKIPEILKLLEQESGQSGAIDVLLATNMISVGVDVPRLGLMVVNGQPKASAEYIQATSRVGRRLDAPGLVVTVYNWARPRDTSHYERFRPYHEAIYRHVEATSVTPFAPRARDRALHAVLIALARILKENWAANDAASRFDANHPLTRKLLDHLQQRVHLVDPSLLPEVNAQLDMLIDWWKTMSNRQGIKLRYQPNPFRPNEMTPVLMHPAEEPRTGGSLPTLNSLREVEGESQLFIKWQ